MIEAEILAYQNKTTAVKEKGEQEIAVLEKEAEQWSESAKAQIAKIKTATSQKI